MFIPIGTTSQSILQVDKDDDGRITQKQLFDVMVRASLISLAFLTWISTVCTSDGSRQANGKVNDAESKRQPIDM